MAMVWSLQTPNALTEQEFGQWRSLLEERTGISLSEQQQAFLQTQITMRMRELGLNDYSEYRAHVMDGLWGKTEWSVLVDRLMIKETSFFRHPASIECVRRLLQNRINNQAINDQVIKNAAGNVQELPSRQVGNGIANNSFDVWSVGCSTGEEPYSLAMVINDCFELAQLKPYYGIYATDISLPALSKAREGIYSKRRLETLSEHHRRFYFQDLHNGSYKVVDRLQERLCFCQANIIELRSMPLEKMDVIYCQNVMIYFQQEQRMAILQQLVEHLKPGGLLVIGLGEVTNWKHPLLQRISDERVQAYLRCDY